MKKDTRRILFWLVVAIVLIGSILAIIFTNRNTSPNGTSTITSVSATDWIKGNPESDIVLVEYSDFQCPACASREALLKDLMNEFGSHIKFAYRHFPLKSIHQNAQLSAQAGEAAGMQDKFWEMHGLIFEHQKDWSDQNPNTAEESFISYAEELGLDAEKFKNDLDSCAAKSAVDTDLSSGLKAGINSTPTFFLNGGKINPRNYDEFRTLIREAIEESG